MKTIEDLKKLREKLQGDTRIRQNKGIKIIVGMGTCGIAAGAREVMSAFMDELTKRNIGDVNVQQTGCIGMCEREVIVDVVKNAEPRITYGRVTASDVPRIIERHILNGEIIEDLVIAKSDI